MKLNRQGNIVFAFMVVILLLTSIYITATVVVSNRYQSVVMYNKIKEQYLAESLVDIQRALLKTKLENTKFTVMFKKLSREYDYEPGDGDIAEVAGYEAQTSVYLFDGYEIEFIDRTPFVEGINFVDDNGDDIMDGYSPILDGYVGKLVEVKIKVGAEYKSVKIPETDYREHVERYVVFDDIAVESMHLLRTEEGLGMRDFVRNLESELRLVYPSTKEDLRISNLCLDAQFWVDLDNDEHNDKPVRKGKLNKLLFESTIKYVGGQIITLFEVDNIYFERNLFKHSVGEDMDFGTAESWINVEEMTITVLDYNIVQDRR